MNPPVLESSAASRASAHVPDRLIRDGLFHAAMATAAREQVEVGPPGEPVLAQGMEQPGAEHDVAVLASLAAPDTNDHPLAVDVADLQRRHLCAAAAGRVEGHQHGALKGRPGHIDQAGDFSLAEHLRQAQVWSRIRRLSCTPTSLQHLDIEEAKGREMLPYCAGRQLLLSQQP